MDRWVARFLLPAGLLAGAAACRGPSSPRAVDNRSGDAGDLVLSTVFAARFPVVGYEVDQPETAGLVDYAATPDPATTRAALALVPEDARENTDGAEPGYYDLDRDGAIDLFLYPQVYFGPSAGHMVHVRDGAGFREVFAGPGQLSVTSVGGRLILHDEIYIIDGAEPRLGYNAIYDPGQRRWSDGPATYHASHGDLPAGVDPARRFSVPAAATLRAAPRVDDTPPAGPPDDGDVDDGEEAWEHTATLRGNVLADFGPGAHGWVVARRGDWWFAAFDPAARPRVTSMGHGMRDVDVEIPEEAFGDDAAMARYDQMLRSRTWLCGWVAAADLDVPAT